MELMLVQSGLTWFAQSMVFGYKYMGYACGINGSTTTNFM